MLLSNLNLLATAPDGVARLRELILTLAVRGKLVPQDPSDEPASELLKKIRAEKDRLILDGKIKRDKPLAEIAGEEKPFELPVAWRLSRLDDIAIAIVDCPHSTPTFVHEGLLCIDTNSFKSGRLVPHKLRYVSESTFAERIVRLQPQPGDLVFAREGSVGESVIIPHGTIACLGQRVMLFRFSMHVSNEFIRMAITSKWFLDGLLDLHKGIGAKHVNVGDMRMAVIPLPPLAEQSRIVTRVEELMRLCDALEAKARLEATQHAQLVATLLGALTTPNMTKATPEALADPMQESWHRVATHFDLLLDRPEAVDALEQTILQLAVRGLLVPQDPQDEPASELLKKIRREKDRLIAEGKIKRDKPLPPIAEDEKPFELPQGWEWVPIDTLASVGSGTTPSRENPAFFVGGTTPWVTSGETGQAFIDATEQHVTDAALAQTSLTVYPVGTLIVAMYGQGKTRGQVAELRIPAATNQACAAIALVEGSAHHRAYVKLVFEKSYDEIRELSAGGAQPNLNVGKVKSTLIPLPPLAEQSRIVARVASLRALCADLRQRLTIARTQQALLAEVLVENIV